jgi:lysophospholipase L1-like esterase
VVVFLFHYKYLYKNIELIMRKILLLLPVTIFILLSCKNHAQEQVPIEDTIISEVKEYPYEQDIRKFEAKDKEHFPEPGMVLFIGSSSVRLWQTLDDDMKGIRVLNRGFGGAITGNVLHYMNRIVFPYKPATIVFYCGDNDIASGKHPDEILKNYREFIQRVHDSLPKTNILMLANKPSMRRFEQLSVQKEVNNELKKICQEYKFVEYIDIATPMMINDTTVRNDIFKNDSLHMNDKGYAIWTGILRKKLIR